MTGGWLLRDVGSLNGTYVNRQRIEEVALAPGDEVQIGKYRFAYLVGGDTGTTS
jgi:pSer/pThr/pTyr-binding forkhead associated (FHA) protein